MTEPCILDVMADADYFRHHFPDPETWEAWRAFLAALFAFEFRGKEAAIFKECTQLEEPDPDGYLEAWLVCGRRGGKSRILALVASFLAAFYDWRPYLASGEKGVVMVMAQNKRAAKVILGYIKAFLKTSPSLRQLIVSETAESITLKRRIVIEVHPCSYRAVRGHTLVAALLDEAAYWMSDERSTNPDKEVLRAVRPAMSTVPKSMLLVASSPYSQKGILWEAYKRWYGQPTKRLVWQAPTWKMNPSVSKRWLAQEQKDDPLNYEAEYGAVFRSDLAAYIDREQVESLVADGVRERPPLEGVTYSAFVDVSAGGADYFTMAVAHREGNIGILDAVRESRPGPRLSTAAIVKEYSALMKRYGVVRCHGDKYARLWVTNQFAEHGITFEQDAPPKDQIYASALPILNSEQCELLDNDRLVNQIVSLERITSARDRDKIGKPKYGHDDLANSALGVLVQLLSGSRYTEALTKAVPLDEEHTANRRWRFQNMMGQHTL